MLDCQVKYRNQKTLNITKICLWQIFVQKKTNVFEKVCLTNHSFSEITKFFFGKNSNVFFVSFFISLNDPFCSSIFGFFSWTTPFLRNILFVLKNVVRSKKLSRVEVDFASCKYILHCTEQIYVFYETMTF